MGAAEWSSVIAAAAAVLGVLIPLIFREAEKRDRLAKASYLIQLHGTYAELQGLQKKIETEEFVESARSEDIAFLVEELRKDIEVRPVELSFRLFVAMAILESFFFLGFAFLEFSDLLTRVLKGPSYETGLYFLEGILGTPAGRSILLAACVASAAAFTLKLSGIATKKAGSHFVKNLILFALFNGVLVVTTAILAGGLMVLDPLVSLW